MDSRRASKTPRRDIEMTTFNQPTIRRARSGSFTGSLNYVREAKPAGSVDFKFSKTTGVMDVKNIVSAARGAGTEMMSRVETLARQNNATALHAATSRPGFFKKVGFDYTPQQKVTNQRKYTPQELHQQEQNRGEGGGGFMMHKPLG